MSLVGYRPLIFKETEIDHFLFAFGVYALKPGITGFAQIHGRDNVSAEQKAAFDRMYLEHFSFLTDVKIVFKTFTYVLKRKDVAF